MSEEAASGKSRLLTPEFQARFHAAAVLVWISLIIPSLLWWSESVLWVIVMSLWANVASHWASYQAAHSEKRIKQQND